MIEGLCSHSADDSRVLPSSVAACFPLHQTKAWQAKSENGLSTRTLSSQNFRRSSGLTVSGVCNVLIQKLHSKCNAWDLRFDRRRTCIPPPSTSANGRRHARRWTQDKWDISFVRTLTVHVYFERDTNIYGRPSLIFGCHSRLWFLCLQDITSTAQCTIVGLELCAPYPCFDAAVVRRVRACVVQRA